MSTTDFRRPRRILVGTDFEDNSEGALHAAFALASSAGDTEVHVAWVRPGLSDGPVSTRKIEKIGDEIDRLREHVEKNLARWQEQHADAPIRAISVHEIGGRPASALVALAAALNAGLIVVGTHGRRGIARAVIGSVASDVVAKASCPVLVVRPIDHRPEAAAQAIGDVEPVCVECAFVRAEGGERLWCDRHAERHPRAHVYGYGGPSTAPARPWGF
jgi:nucleotide-binding universal stress UspA family protein